MVHGTALGALNQPIGGRENHLAAHAAIEVAKVAGVTGVNYSHGAQTVIRIRNRVHRIGGLLVR